MKKDTNCQVAVIGIGCYYPGAKSPLQLWENILSRRQQFRQMPDLRLPNSDYFDPDPTTPDKTYLNKAAILDGYKFDWLDKRIPKKTFESTDIVHWLALDTALQAIADARYSKENINRDKTGVVLGNTLTGEFTRSNTMLLRWPYVRKVLRASLKQKGLTRFLEGIENTMEKYYKSVFAPVTEDTLAGSLANTIAGRICNYLNINGGGYIVDGACSSSILAICTAANYLELGQMDMVIAGGVDISLDTFELIGFAKTGALTHGEMRVYDKQGDGFIPGEGCGIVVLKRLEDAVRDNDQVYAILNGWGISSDGKGGITAPNAVGQSLAIMRAYEKCDFDTEKLNFIEGHGTGTTVGDKAELEGITIALNHKKKIPYRNCGVTSFKSIVGHTKAAAGVGAFIKTVIALNRRILPPTAGLRESNRIFDEVANTLYPITQGQVRDPNSILYAGVSAMGFGGINSHVLLQSADAPSPKFQPSLEERKLLVSDQTTEVFLFASNSSNELAEIIKDLLANCKGISYGEMADLAFFHNKSIDQTKIYRAGIVASNPFELERKLNVLKTEILKKDLEKINSLENNTIVFGKKKKRLRIGALFPGQGSQQINMTYKLHERFDWVRDFFINTSDILLKETSENILDTIYKITDRFKDTNEEKEQKSHLVQTYIAQPAIVFSSLVWKKYLERIGITFSCASGHSLGELMAFHTAGLLDEETVIRFAAFRGNSMFGSGSGTMASLICNDSKAYEYISTTGGYVTVANINAPEQTVISGDKESVAIIIKRAETDQIAATELPVSAAFHSELISETADAIENYDLLRTKHNLIPNFKLVSSVTGEIIPDKINPNQYFSLQAISQVNFIKAINAIKAECDILIEVGPGKVLSGLTSNITDDIRCFPVEAKAKDETSFNTMLANIFVYGANLNITEVYAERLIREFVPASKREFIVNPLERPIFGYIDAETTKTNEDLKHPDLGTLSVNQGLPFNVAPKLRIINQQPLSESDSKKSVKNTVFNLISDRTGFPVDQLSASFRLLNDLNLDSIKAGSLLAELIKMYQLQGKMEHAKYSNASVEEIIESIENLLEKPLQSKPVPEEEKTGEHLVRSYCVELTEEVVNVNPLDTLSKKINRLGIAYCDSDRRKKGYFENEIKSLADDVVYIEHDNLKIYKEKLDTLIVFVPEVGADIDYLNDIVALLSHVAAFTATTQPETCFIQWGDGYFSRNNKKNTKNIVSAIAFASSLHLERPNQKIRVVELRPNILSKQLVQLIFNELSTNNAFDVSGYPTFNKKIKQVYEIADKKIKSKRKINLNSGDVILITGGAKGITAECAFAFAETYQCRMVLVGSSVLNDEIQQTLARYNNKKLVAKYYSCDITDRNSVDKLIETVKSELGNISGVIHGAGINIPRRTEDVTSTEAIKEIAPKLIGALHIIDATKNLNLKYFIALTSAIGVTGMQGNSWYAFSNETLDLLLRNLANKNLETITYAYSVWNHVGMGERMCSTKVLANLGIGSISPKQGISEFLKWLDNKTSDQQVVIAAGLGSLDTWQCKIHLKPPANRYLEKILQFEYQKELVVQAVLDRDTDKYINDHNYHNSLLFPTVFGLEAMAQAASMVSGIKWFNSVIVENISLLYPIVIPNEGDITIQIKASAKSENSGLRVFTSISTEETNYLIDHFSAEFLLNSTEIPENIFIDVPENFLPIEPKSDLYSWLLFQGETFQNIDKVYQLSSKSAIFSTKRFSSDTSEICFSQENITPFVLGSPLLRDVLLQSGQLILTQNEYLPIRINRWIIFDINKQKQGGIVECNLLNENKNRAVCDVLFVGNDKKVIEYIEGYEVKRLRPTSHYPAPETIAGLSVIYSDELKSHLKLYEKEIALNFDIVMYKHYNQFNLLGKQARHEIEEDVFTKTYLPENSNNLSKSLNSLIWNERGRPCIKGSNINISVSHSKSLLLMVFGTRKQGCDIEFVEHRSKGEWDNLIPQKQHKILLNIEKFDKNADISATRLWAVNETIIKAYSYDLDDILVEKVINEAIIFKTTKKSKPIYITTFPISLIPNNAFIVALITEVKNNKFTEAKKEIIIDDHELFDEASGRLVQYFNTSFKDCNGFFGKTYFTNYPDWMGKLREQVLSPIGKQLINDLSSGKFGMVTNLSKIKIFNEAEALNKIAGTINITDQSNLDKSYIHLEFEWFKKNETGDWIKLAESNLSTTWVTIEGHGIVKQSPLPDYFYKFLLKYINKKFNTSPIGRVDKYLSKKDLEPLIYKSSKPKPEILIDRKVFRTGILNGNSVGNLYYSNYYDWQAKMIEGFLYQISPEIYTNNGKMGEYIILESSVTHLQEAMPFEDIEVSMYIDEIYKNGSNLYFEYYSGSNNKRKLAYGNLILIWAKRDNENKLPEAYPLKDFQEKFLKKITKNEVLTNLKNTKIGDAFFKD